MNRELAEKLFETLKAIDLYEVRDNDYTLENALNDIENDPKAVIEYLCDTILEMV